MNTNDDDLIYYMTRVATDAITRELVTKFLSPVERGEAMKRAAQEKYNLFQMEMKKLKENQ